MYGKTIYEFYNKDSLRRYGKGLILDLHGPHRVLSTSMLNGGISDHLEHIFNFNCLADDYDCTLTYDTYEEELVENAKSLNLDPNQSTGLSTAAFIELASIQTKSYKEVSVTAIVTAGIDYNAVRAGDPASYYEISNQYTPLTPGTINIFLHINHAMPAGALVRAATICTEAKSVALGELMLGSNYSSGIATGSGTDGTIIISDLSTTDQLTDAGGHSKLGELIATSVIDAVKDALRKQTCASPARQHSLLERGKRYGITIGSLWTYNQLHSILPYDIQTLEHMILSIHQNSNVVVFTSLYLHLLDQYEWKLYKWAEVLRESHSLCNWFLATNQIDASHLPYISYTVENPMESLINQFQHTILLRLYTENETKEE